MKLTLSKLKYKDVDKKFINYLISYIYDLGIKYLEDDNKKLSKIDDYLNNVYGNKAHLKAYNIICVGLDNLICIETQTAYIIQINPVVKLSHYSSVTLLSLCSLINFGNLQLQAFPIFTTIFKQAEDNLDAIIEGYKLSIKSNKDNSEQEVK